MLDSLQAKLGLKAVAHFSLVVEHVKSLKRNKLTLLNPRDTLAKVNRSSLFHSNIFVCSNPPKEGWTSVVRKKKNVEKYVFKFLLFFVEPIFLTWLYFLADWPNFDFQHQWNLTLIGIFPNDVRFSHSILSKSKYKIWRKLSYKVGSILCKSFAVYPFFIQQ